MASLLTINNLNYQVDNQIFFKNFSLKIETKDYVSIIAPNGSGKTLLIKLISAIIPTEDIFKLDGISLNKKNILKYLPNLGLASNDIHGFLYKKVKDELAYPLQNLGFSEHKINKMIAKISNNFQITDILDTNINKLDNSKKAMLQIIISLIHEPKLLVLDDAFNNMNIYDQEFMLKKLKELNNQGLTILNITSKLDTIYDSNQIMVLNNFQIEKSGTLLEIIEDDNYLRKIGLEIPFIIDLSLKLKFYELLDKIYFNLEELEESLWK